MAQGKKSVLLYCDLIHTIEKMSDENAGKFFKHYLRYVNDLDPIAENELVDLVFEGVKQNLKRDLKKWSVRAENSRNNGALGGRPKKKPSGLLKNQVGLKKPVTDTVTVTDTVNVNGSVIDIKKQKKGEILKENMIWPNFSDFWDAYDKKTGKKEKINKQWSKLSQKTKKKIMEYIPNYIISQPNKRYRLNPETFLNNDGWENELIMPESAQPIIKKIENHQKNLENWG